MSWLSRMPAPSKPAASMSWIRRISSGMGAVPGTRRWTRTALISLVAGTALLTERRHAFREVDARPHLVAEGLLHCLAGARVLRNGGGDLELHRLHGGRAVGGDLLSRGEGPRHQLLRSDHAIDQAYAHRLRRVDEAAGEQEIHGVRVANLLDELEGRPAEWIDRPRHLGQPEARVGRGAADVRGEQELQSAPDAVAIDGAYHGFGVGIVLEERVAHHARGFRRGAQVAADVGARAEGSRARPREHDAAAITRLQLVPELREIGEHGPRHGVEPRRIVDGDENDVGTVPLGANLHQRAPGSTTTLPCARRDVSSPIASTGFSSGRRWLMHGLSLPSRYQARSASTERRTLSGACQR